MRTDLYFLRDTLPAKHLNLFAKISRSDFEKSIVSLDARIDTLDEESFFTEIFQIIKAIGDEHTRFRPDLSPYRLPIRFTLFKEGCFVTEAHQSELLLGKLIAINGIDMEEIINRFKKILRRKSILFRYIFAPIPKQHIHFKRIGYHTDQRFHHLHILEYRS